MAIKREEVKHIAKPGDTIEASASRKEKKQSVAKPVAKSATEIRKKASK